MPNLEPKVTLTEVLDDDIARANAGIATPESLGHKPPEDDSLLPAFEPGTERGIFDDEQAADVPPAVITAEWDKLPQDGSKPNQEALDPASPQAHASDMGGVIMRHEAGQDPAPGHDGHEG